MKVRVISIPPTPNPSETQQRLLDNEKCIPWQNFNQFAWVIDGALPLDFLETIDRFRVSLPLDTKRSTVKRRFFSSARQFPAIREGLAAAIQAAVSTASGIGQVPDETLTAEDVPPHVDKDAPQVGILAYMRFLEYDQIGGRLDAHTDGNKVCEDTGHRSTHTMLLYLRDCPRGGETFLFEKTTPPRVVEAVRPLRGRILLFPHPTLHEGAPTVDVPKLCLRAEVCLWTK